MRVLITNNTLGPRAGTELYVRDIAPGLLDRGHTPIAYSTTLGEVARELRAMTIPVVDDLDALGSPPDVIHGQHHLQTMTALLRFPGVPAVYFCHGWLPWEENPPRFPRIRRYVAVDATCRDRLTVENGIPEERVRLLLNFVDMDRFKARSALPQWPARALVFSNTANERTHVAAIREACRRAGITVDVIGAGSGNPAVCPEEVLGNYDLVFAKARSALEAMAVGTAVILCDADGAGPLVTSDQFDRLRVLNFGVRAMQDPIDPGQIEVEIGRYDPVDAAEVSRRVRTDAGRESVIDEIVSIYEEIAAESASLGADDKAAEEVAASRYLEWLGVVLKDRYRLHAENQRLRQQIGERDQRIASVESCKPRSWIARWLGRQSSE